MKSIVKSLVILLFSISYGLYAQGSETVENAAAGNAFNEGNKLISQKKYNEAINSFKEAIKEDSKFYQAYYMLGLTYKVLNKMDEAIESHKKTIAINPKYDKAYIALGNIYIKQRNFDSAINSFNAAIGINGKSEKAYFGLGYTYYKLESYDQAITQLTKAVGVTPDYAKAYMVLGICYDKVNQLGDAVKAFSSAIENESNTRKGRETKGECNWRLGDVYVKLNQLKNAEDSYSEAIKLAKSKDIIAGANFGLGEVNKKRGKKQTAINYYKKASLSRIWKGAAKYEIEMLNNSDKYSN